MKTVLITGATRGIGAAIAKTFIDSDARLILTGTKNRSEYEFTETADADFQYVQVDFADPDSLTGFIRFINTLERLDVCVNNAAINIIKPMESVTLSDLELLNRVNYFAPYRICQAASKVMRKKKFGRIVNIASIWSALSKPGRTLYSGAKTGLVGMTRTMSTEVAADNVLVNCVSPGFTLTELTRDSLSDDEMASITAQIPIKRMADPIEIARVVHFLCSEKNTYLTGQNIIVDGGFTIV